MTLTFALDFDETFTACPSLWAEFIGKAKAQGHRVLIVTARRATDENHETVNEMLAHWGCQIPVIFTSLGSKIDAMKRRDIKVDIWIDDDPASLVRGH
jgi:hypothetical protein